MSDLMRDSESQSALTQPLICDVIISSTVDPFDWVHEYFGMAVPASVFTRAWLIMSLAELGRFAEAAKYEAEAIQFAEHSHDLEISLMSGVISARIDAASGSPAQRREVAKRLNAVAQQAKAALLR